MDGDSLMPVTKDQATALTELAAAIRPHGARRWDKPGIYAAIGKVRDMNLADVAMAVIRAADDRSLETPGAIGNPSAPCWADKRIDRPQPITPYDPLATCGVCGKDEGHCRRTEERLPVDIRHEFTSTVDVARRARKAQETTDAI
jgi:hypothetical protein